MKVHDINKIRNDKTAFVKSMSDRFVEIDIDKILNLDAEKRELIYEKARSIAALIILDLGRINSIAELCNSGIFS